MVNRDRGQLILVGAIAIALILLGLVLIVNTALFTQVVGSEGTTQTVKDGGVSSSAIGESIADVVAENNSDATYSTSYNDIDTNVTSAVDDDLERAFVNRNLEGSGSFYSMSYLGRTVDGSTISQNEVSTFEDATDRDDWDVITDLNRSDVGGFSMVIHTDQSSLSNDFEVRVDDGSDDVTLTVAPNGSNVDVTVDGPSTTVSCTGIGPTNDTVRIDVSHGRVYEDSGCQFDVFQALEPGYAIEFRNGNEVEGTYELAMPSTHILDNSLDPRFSTADDDPTHTPAVWAFEYEYLYDSSAATLQSERREVDVYD